MQNSTIKRTSMLCAKAMIILIGIGVLAAMLIEPHFEGRNANATFFEVYFKDPFLAYAYIGSIAFFVALYQTFILLGSIEKNQMFSLNSMRAFRTIKYCGITLVIFIVGALAYAWIAIRGKDDIAGGVAMGLFATLISIVIATTAAVFERKLQHAMAMKEA